MSPLLPAAEAIAQWIDSFFDIKFDLQKYWSDIFLLISLYLTSRAFSYWRSGLRAQAYFRIIFGLVVSLATSAVAGALPSEDAYQDLMMLFVVLMGLTLFDICDGAWAATFFRKEQLNWSQDFTRYALYSLPPILFGGILIVVFHEYFDFLQKNNIYQPGIFALFIYAIFLALYWMMRGFYSPSAKAGSNGRFSNFLKSSNTKIAFLMLQSIGGAIIVLLFNAGYNLATQ